jgi:myo-inositol-1(or 4)-monophosphatase
MTWTHERQILHQAIRTAGAESLKIAANGFEIHIKADQSPVTSADLAVNHILYRHLLDAFPDDGWLSEESPDSEVRLDKRRVWVIDPIDGTSAFIRREPEFCISVALIEDGRPVLAAIFNPSTDELYAAIRGEGLHLNDRPVVAQHGKPGEATTIALSPWEQQLGRFKSLEARMTGRPMRSIAWALALAASGRIEAVATWESQNEWDIAAGALLVQEGGGKVSDGAGMPLRFNQRDPRSQGMVATSHHCPLPVADQLRTLLPSAH